MKRIFSFVSLTIIAVCAAVPQSASGQSGEWLDAVARGLGLTRDEAAVRIDWQEKFRAAAITAMADHENFAGVTHTGSDGSYRLHVYYVGDNPPRDHIEALVPADLPAIEWTRVKYNYHTLSEVMAAIVAGDYGANQVGIRIALNLVEVVAPSGSKAAAGDWPFASDIVLVTVFDGDPAVRL
jgi:hypothetical protein